MLGSRRANCRLISAIRDGRLEDARVLINSFRGRSGYAPLHFAVEKGSEEVVTLLLSRGANVNEKGEDSITPLHIAAQKGYIRIAEDLLNHGADTNCLTLKEGYTPLHFACELGKEEFVKLFLNRGADINASTKDNVTPLHIATQKGYIRIAEDLLNHGAYTHSLTLKEGYTPLHFACKLGKEEIVKLFLNRGADINASTKDNVTPLHIATKIGHKNVVKLLLQHGAKVDNQDNDGKTILQLAVKKGSLKIIEDVLKYSPDIHNQSNRSSLKIAVCSYGKEYEKIVEVLLDYGLSVNPEDANDAELLHAAVEKGYLKIVEDLLKYGANVNKSHHLRFKEDFIPLHSAAETKQAEIAKLLISYEADINAKDRNGRTPIFYAIKNADLKITKLLLTNRANIKDDPELLIMAVEKECIEVVETLLQHDADINASDACGRTALHFTALRKRDGFCGFILENLYVNINKKAEIAKLLLSKGANVNAQTKDGVTTLHAAVQKGYAKVVEVLLEYNANVNSVSKSDVTPLHLSVERGNEEVSTMLLNKGAKVNAKRKDGRTALHIATQRGCHLGSQKSYQKIIETILKFGADVDSRDEYGTTALHMASQEGRAKFVVTLLEYGSDINITSRNNHTPLGHAMAGIESFSQANRANYGGFTSWSKTFEALERHIIKMKTANLYVSEKNSLSMCIEFSRFKLKEFQNECEKEIASMKSEKINNANISFYHILAKCTSSLAIYMRNENIVQVLKSDDYKKKFPTYASMIECNFRKGMARKELLEQGNKSFQFLFNNSCPGLPCECAEKILGYLSGEDLKILIDACKSLKQYYTY